MGEEIKTEGGRTGGQRAVGELCPAADRLDLQAARRGASAVTGVGHRTAPRTKILPDTRSKRRNQSLLLLQLKEFLPLTLYGIPQKYI